jgi:hypothetical protein
MRYWRAIIAIVGLGLLGMPAFGADIPNPTQPANFPQPGTLNYVEGSAYVDGSQISNRSVGSVELKAGQELTTGAGKTEVLLTPGIFLRVDSNSAIKMISPELEQTQVELQRGKLGVEVDQIFPQNMIQIMDNGVTTQLMKTGYYEFGTNPPEAKVFDGQAEVGLGDGKWEKVKGHHELALAEGAREKTQDFNSHPVNDDLYNWSKLRSQYLAEANNQIAGEYAYGPGFYPGWYWDPWMWDYTYLGWGPFDSPFGWGFYPWGGFYGGLGLYGGGFYGGRFYHHGWYGRGAVGNHYYGHGSYNGGFRGGAMHGGFAGGGRAFAGGGFHGGGMGGGFHGGGGFGGGRR